MTEVRTPAAGGPCPCAYVQPGHGPISLHDGHCCFRDWDPSDVSTHCHERELLTLVATGRIE